MAKSTPRSVRKSKVQTQAIPTRVERGPLERIYGIRERIADGETVTAVSLALDFGVTALTIKRDIAMMRDRLGMPVEWDAAGKTYHFSSECDTVPLLRINRREALTLAVIGRVLEGWQGAPFGRDLDGIVKKIAPVLGGKVSIAVNSIDRILSLPDAAQLRELDSFYPILTALIDRRELWIEYVKAGSKKAEKRLLQPLHLSRLADGWVLVAHDPTARVLRHFVLSRMRNVTPTKTTFEPPPDFDARAHLRGSLGRFVGDKDYEICLALDAHAAVYARETPWHLSQKLADLPDGRVELTLRLNHLTDIKNVVLRWGEHVEVLAPAELRHAVKVSLEAALARYSSKPE